MTEEKYEDFLAELMEDPEFKKEYEAMQPEFDAIRTKIQSHTDNIGEKSSEFPNKKTKREITFNLKKYIGHGKKLFEDKTAIEEYMKESRNGRIYALDK
ncbi:MAG: hypothetical protein IKN12_03230 [Selenomonadaceae bacterium]|nr:hypothetical protein [Selenomonadaceae bacterium]